LALFTLASHNHSTPKLKRSKKCSGLISFILQYNKALQNFRKIKTRAKYKFPPFSEETLHDVWRPFSHRKADLLLALTTSTSLSIRIPFPDEGLRETYALVTGQAECEILVLGYHSSHQPLPPHATMIIQSTWVDGLPWT
jgi:hypothetical protein